MSQDRPRRALWLLNHATARTFEVAMLRQAGVPEVFGPKRYPADPAFRSANVDWSLDAALTIPPDELALLNAVDWYGEIPQAAWDLANRHFDLVFFNPVSPTLLAQLRGSFQGAVLLRAYGMPADTSYSALLRRHWRDAAANVADIGRRFWFATAYEGLAEVEEPLLARRELHLPLGLTDVAIRDDWQGGDSRVLFVCPDIAINPYYREIYRRFREDFPGLPHLVAGMQAQPLADPAVLGFLPRAAFEQRLREAPALFYHSSEPRHVHYHPFEAVRAGLPLVFMAGGLLDRLGGRDLPGRCRSVAEARRLLDRLLAGDRGLAERLRRSQGRLLDAMRPEAGAPLWKRGIARVLEDLARTRAQAAQAPRRVQRIAVILPQPYRGGTLRGAKAIAAALVAGAADAGTTLEVVLAHVDLAGVYEDEDFADLAPGVTARPFRWAHLAPDQARRALIFAGLEARWEAKSYIAPHDGIDGLAGCDLWLVISDRFTLPLLPLRRTVMMNYDYLHRYEPRVIDHQHHIGEFIAASHAADRVLVTTDFTAGDAVTYAGLPSSLVRRVPLLFPPAPEPAPAPVRAAPPAPRPKDDPARGPGYFMWSTNLAAHKNHDMALRALRLYYEELGGRLTCVVTGVNSARLFEADATTRDAMTGNATAGAGRQLRRHLRLRGELSEPDYWRLLRGAAFLWHPTRIDNGTFGVIEAAQAGVPSLSSDYPAMREMDRTLGLGLAWMDPRKPRDMAEALSRMEAEALERRALLPRPEALERYRQGVAGGYWSAVRDLL